MIDSNAFRNRLSLLERVHLEISIAGQASGYAQVAALAEYWHPNKNYRVGRGADSGPVAAGRCALWHPGPFESYLKMVPLPVVGRRDR